MDNDHFVLGGKYLDIVQEFMYLGILFSCTNNLKCQSAWSKQASRAKCKKFDLPVDVQIELLNTLVLPIMTYGCG